MRELALQGAAQIVNFLFVDEQVAVACDAELVTTGDLDAREQFVNEGADCWNLLIAHLYQVVPLHRRVNGWLRHSARYGRKIMR